MTLPKRPDVGRPAFWLLHTQHRLVVAATVWIGSSVSAFDLWKLSQECATKILPIRAVVADLSKELGLAAADRMFVVEQVFGELALVGRGLLGARNAVGMKISRQDE